ncbi:MULTISPECIES: 4Fe-4S binding protein [Anaerostipes]|nr:MULTISPECIES: 4Fe-4S binding protein [Anaerostipes]WRY48080.1 4Fe-4S binding protein [Anaerostipes sp. PC18]
MCIRGKAEACIGCGTCRDVCPQKCISEGMPYIILQDISHKYLIQPLDNK